MHFVKTEESLTVFKDSGTHQIPREHKDWNNIVAHLMQGEDDLALALINPATKLLNYVDGPLTIKDSYIYFEGDSVDNSVARRILQMHKEGQPIQALILFLKNLMENPSKRAVQELYGFLEYGQLPITKDGHFLAYKRVNRDYTDCHSGKMDNSIGKIVKMTRFNVDDNCNNTCSTGLHFCSKEYLKSFRGARLVAVKINPRDVVSIPIDYNNTKGRCCRYEVVDELDLATMDWGASVVGDYEQDPIEEEHISDASTAKYERANSKEYGFTKEQLTLLDRIAKIDLLAYDYIVESAHKLRSFNPSASTLIGLFAWKETPQGGPYWADIDDALVEQPRH